MLLRTIPEEFDAILYDGTNSVDVTKFCLRHGAQVNFETNDDYITTGLLHTVGGSERILRGNYVLSSKLDQVFRIHADYVHSEAARYVIVPEEESNAAPAPDA